MIIHQIPKTLLSLTLVSVLLALFPAPAQAQAQGPGWWTARGVLNTNQPSDYAPINQGQLKALAQNACLQMQQYGETNLSALISGFSNSNNFALVNIGQLKNVAKPFYDRLEYLDMTAAMPSDMTNFDWDTPSADNYALANIGQAKYLFSFNLDIDSDSDGLPDLWEMVHFGDLGETDSGDFDGDGLTNHDEFDMGLNPTLLDTDGDAANDGDEVAQGRDPLASAVSDTTGIVNLKVYTALE